MSGVLWVVMFIYCLRSSPVIACHDSCCPTRREELLYLRHSNNASNLPDLHTPHLMLRSDIEPKIPQGFLSAQLSFPQLIAFGLSLFANSTNATRANLLVKGLPGLVVMLGRLLLTTGHDARIAQEARSWEAEREARKPESLNAPRR